MPALDRRIPTSQSRELSYDPKTKKLGRTRRSCHRTPPRVLWQRSHYWSETIGAQSSMPHERRDAPSKESNMPSPKLCNTAVGAYTPSCQSISSAVLSASADRCTNADASAGRRADEAELATCANWSSCISDLSLGGLLSSNDVDSWHGILKHTRTAKSSSCGQDSVLCALDPGARCRVMTH